MWGKIERRLARIIPVKKIKMNNPKGIVSFSFDDAPRSACRLGREILEEKKATATYYLSGSFHGTEDKAGPFHNNADLVDLVDNGHEIACYGFGHLDYQQLTSREIEADIERNRRYFMDAGLDMPPVNFAYPYGCVSPRIKAMCGRMFTSARGVTAGINAKTLDLALLKSFPLYEHMWSPEKIEDVMRETMRRKGWTIFFTHGVADTPDAFGCTPGLLEHAAFTAARSGCEILSVKHGLGRVAFRPN